MEVQSNSMQAPSSGCCKGSGCCKYPQGTMAIIASSCAIAAMLCGFTTCAVLLSVLVQGTLGLSAMIMLICASCKKIKKCTFIVAAVFCFLCAVVKIVDAALIEAWNLCGWYYCEDKIRYGSKWYQYDIE